MTRVLVTRPLPERVLEAARAQFDLEVRESTAPMDGTEMRAALALYDGVLPTLGDRFSEEVFAEVETPRCRILANFGVGYNHIDVAAARARGVTVTNTPGAVTDATADIGMMLILTSCRRASEGERLLRAGAWEGWHPTQLLGLHVTGKRLGVVGFGRIGQAIARRAHLGFGMEIAYANRSEKQAEVPATRMALLDLAAWADVLVVALPGGAETRHMIGAEVFAAMPAHARFVNIARGDIVDEAALIDALRSGEIAGAGLDVYEREPEVPRALTEMEQVTLLPHLGTAALEVREAMGHMAVENLAAFFAGRAVPNTV
ncbi:D-glycerate dehydrogenase [Rhodosalinus sediminis]|uniref:D-glycerate dehydrogenase n=1 Tax=Rhodosalinus sediminis TaxID=1940533 RepID=A0A3D9BYV6_9RHOB|nr:D-glycerate dehydrogenase [Rhodosalinus sediminis]REC58678.1 D-glycerate dehydrogenase [Rhodosalinus sediminis]